MTTQGETNCWSTLYHLSEERTQTQGHILMRQDYQLCPSNKSQAGTEPDTECN